MVAPNLEPLSHIADEDAVQRAVEPAEAGMARGLSECGFEQVPVQPDLIPSLQYAASGTAGMEERFCVRVHGQELCKERLAL